MLQEVLYAAAPLIALTNPVSELSLFLTVVEGRSSRERRMAALQASLGVLCILAATVLVGRSLLELLGIQIPAFRAAGGLLVVLMGLEMVQGDEPVLQRSSSETEDDRLWVPFVMPMLAGPGAIVTAMTLSLREAALRSIPWATLMGSAIASSLVLLVLLGASEVADRTSIRARRILSRFSGIVLVAIGFQMGFTGIAEFFGVRP